MNAPVYKKWNPLPDIPVKLLFEELHHGDDHFRVDLRREKDKDSILRISFDFVLFYRTANESYSLKALQKIENIGEASLYSVEGSSLISWFHEESLNIYENWSIRHYAILTPDEGITWALGKTVSIFSHGDNAVRVLKGALALTDQTLFAVDQFLFDATPLALDELTFEVADRTNVGSVDLGYPFGEVHLSSW